MDRWTRRDFLATMGLGAGALAARRPTAARDRRRPNLLFILCDDLGWVDTSVYGSTLHRTPNIDALARRGMRFTQAYAANPLCSPTRASILTGQWPARIGITAPVCHVPEERLEASVLERANPQFRAVPCESATRLKPEYVTLAETLAEAGYRTGHFGKWHLGPDPYDPLHQGFSVDVPHTSGPGPAGSYLGPWKFPAELSFTGQPGEHIEDRMATEAARFIRENRDQPFYLNYWAFSVHSPWDAKPELVEQYRSAADPGNPQHNPLYAAMVQSLDEGVGRVMKALDEEALTDDTIVIFFSDNGGVNWYDESMKTRYGMDCPPTSNVPLRGGKASLYEGGTRVPCLIAWPGVARAGSRSDAIIQSIDFFPTVLDMLGLPAPAGQPFDGISIVPALKGGKLGRDAIFCFFPHAIAVNGQVPGAYVRQGDWKLIRCFFGGPAQTHRYELYNLREDLGETTNLAERMPRKVAELDALLEGFLRETKAVLPIANPAYDPEAFPVVDGWRPSGQCKIRKQEGALIITAIGGDPFVVTADVPAEAGSLVVRFRLRSDSSGVGQFFHADEQTPQFGPTVRLSFAPVHDGEWHEYDVRFSAQGLLKQIRIDPCAAPGKVEIDWVRLCREDGTLLKAWEFE
jgi:arylsulfatase A-like enzyme